MPPARLLFLGIVILAGDLNVNTGGYTALLLNEVSEKDAKVETKFPKMLPKFAAKNIGAFLAGRKVLPPNFTTCFTSEISDFKSKFTKKLHDALLQAWQPSKLGKEGFGVKKLPFPSAPEMGALSQKIPNSLQGSTRKMGIFDSKRPFLGH